MPDRAAPSRLPQRPSAGLRVTHREAEDGWCVVSVEGEVDLASAPVLKSALVELLVGRGYTRFALELSRLGYMDSTGLGVLSAFRQRLGADGRLTLIGMPPNLLSVLRVSGLDRAFEICAGGDGEAGQAGGPRRLD
jgi:anti-sigma B factor antagonist